MADTGLTDDLRDYFAAQALTGFLADGSQRKIAAAVEAGPGREFIQDTKALTAIINEQLATGAYALADAMLAARAITASRNAEKE